MPWRELGPSEFHHLEFVREPERVPERRRRRGFGASILRPENRQRHAGVIRDHAQQAVTAVVEARRQLGVQADRLLVLEFDSINFDLRDVLEQRLGAYVLDERQERLPAGEDRYRFLVQFADRARLAAFQAEIQSYSVQEGAPTALPAGLRRDFFDALQDVRPPSRRDRIGARLASEGYPASGEFYIDVDLWHPGDEDGARLVLDDVRRLCAELDGRVADRVRTQSLLLVKIIGSARLAEALLDLDIVARLDLPPRISEAYALMFIDTTLPTNLPAPNEDDPVVCILDSGVLAGHPYLATWVVDEVDFESGEGTPVDLNGHGTAVAGILAYGDVSSCIRDATWEPTVKICSAKVLKNDPITGRAVFPEELRVERVTEEAIRYFAAERNCRVYNLSIGNAGDVYQGQRQFPWAEKLDELSRELDIVIVVPSGNRADVPIPGSGVTRDEFGQQLRQ